MQLNYNIVEHRSQEIFSKKRSMILQRIAERIQLKNKLFKYYETAIENENQKKYLKDCGTFLEIDTKDRIIKANFCKNRLCPICNYRKSIKTWAKITKRVNEIDYKYIFITLTIKNVIAENLNKSIDDMMIALKKLTNRRQWKRIIKGYIRGLEITYNATDKSYHPHFHVLCAVPTDYYSSTNEDYISFRTLQKMWKESTNADYNINVFIEPITEKENAVAEVAKYAVKIADVLSSKIDFDRVQAMKTIAFAIRNRRLIGTAGVLKMNNIDEEVIDECKGNNTTRYIWSGNGFSQLKI